MLFPHRLLLAAAVVTLAAAAQLSFVCRPDNDIFALLSQQHSFARYDSVAEALTHTQSGSLMVLADGYPTQNTLMSLAQIETARHQNVAVFLEAPAALPRASCAPLAAAEVYHRLVVNRTAGIGGLEPLSLLMAQGAWFVDIRECDTCLTRSALVYAKVAGVDTATYGMPPDALLNPVLFDHGSAEATDAPELFLVSAIKLSVPVSSRFEPVAAWQSLWAYILTRMSNGTITELPTLPQLAHPYKADPRANVSVDDERQSFVRASQWLHRLTRTGNDSCPAPYLKEGAATVTPLCMFEGYSSLMDYNGTQQLATGVRMDCTLETAMVFALRAALVDGQGRDDAGRLLDYAFFQSVAQQGARADENAPQYGLLTWGTSSPALTDAFYGDDNARALLGAITASAALQRADWDVSILRGVLANVRTASQSGFRPGRINAPDIDKLGWRHYFSANYTFTTVPSPQPHYQARLWYVYLWTYARTRLTVLRDRALQGITATMEAFPAWPCTEYASEEYGAMIHVLAWLVRVEPAVPVYRAWLRQASEAYLARQQTVGGCVQESLGTVRCSDPPPASNKAYGSAEAPITQSDNDTIADMLYSNNFALIGLLEAYHATEGDDFYGKALDALVGCVVRVQATSVSREELDGGWMRGWDYARNDYWGSSSDAGWGVWSMESGWTTTWIATTLAIRQFYNSPDHDRSLWAFTQERSSIAPGLARTVCQTFFKDDLASICDQD